MIGKPADILTYIFNADKETEYEVKEYKEKRSSTSNGYLWNLVNKIGNVLRKSKEDVYLQMLKDYGQSEVMSMLSSIDPKGYFKYYEEIGKGIVSDKEFTHYKIFKGSSSMNSKEMSILIEGTREEAKQLDIEVMTPSEMSMLNYE